MAYEEISLDEIVEAVKDKIKEEATSFEDIVILDSQLNREIFLGAIVEGVGSSVDNYIRYWNRQDEEKNIPIEDREPIKIYIDSFGGSLTDTFTMIDSIQLSKTPIWTICTGAAYSGGFFTFISGHKRIAYPLASFLYHEGSTGQVSDAGKFRNFADFYSKQLNQLKNITLKYTNITEEQYESHIKDDWWLTAEEALELGVCDTISKELA